MFCFLGDNEGHYKRGGGMILLEYECREVEVVVIVEEGVVVDEVGRRTQSPMGRRW